MRGKGWEGEERKEGVKMREEGGRGRGKGRGDAIQNWVFSSKVRVVNSEHVQLKLPS